MVRTFLFYILIAVHASTALADVDTSTRIFDRHFRTLKTSLEDDFMSPPVIRLGTNDRIIVNFDEIGEENSFLEYRLIHCNADWQPSRLIESQYVDGFNSQRIEDFEYSYSTYVHFVNYQIAIPNDDLRILHSGNYLLQVYDPDSPDDTLLQTRFQVSEGAVDIAGEVTTRTDQGHYSRWQQLELTVNADGLGSFNPYQDIFLDVSQNMREETSRRLPSPQRVSGSTLFYSHSPLLIYPASNEYRRFESVSNAFAGIHVDSLRYMGTNYHIWLKKDRPRANAEYSFDRTQHGRFLVREYNSSNSDLSADYITVHFRLEMSRLPDKEVFVEGEFSRGLFDDAHKMTYDPELGAYTAEIPLKQGAYNYQYVTRQTGSSAMPDPTEIEGDKYETGNEYNVTVYYRPPGAWADRIVGTRTVFMP